VEGLGEQSEGSGSGHWIFVGGEWHGNHYRFLFNTKEKPRRSDLQKILPKS
jgi:hypothetical protein